MSSLSTSLFSAECEGTVFKRVSKRASKRASEKVLNRDELESAKAQSRTFKTIKVTDTTSCDDVPVLRRAAMDYLARREHSMFELTQKLGKKFPDTDQELLAEVVGVLESENLQSDDRFTESYVRYRKSRGFAYLHIRADLASRRVDENVIDKHLLIDDEHWQLTADQLVAKKLRGQEPFGFGSKLHRKLTRFLESRGFSSIEIKRALEKYLT